MEISAKWKHPTEEWKDFDFNDFKGYSRTHAINCFSGNIPVVIMQGNTRIVNNEILLEQYRKARKKVVLLSECLPSNYLVLKKGFIDV